MNRKKNQKKKHVPRGKDRGSGTLASGLQSPAEKSLRARARSRDYARITEMSRIR